MLVSIITPFHNEEPTLLVLLDRAVASARLLKAGNTIHEIPVRYEPRTFARGKKVRPQGGLRALWVLLRIRLEGRRRSA